MDYEKKYKEALTYVKDLIEHNVISKENAGKYFPELAESEDEKIRRRIIHALHGDVLEMSEIKEAVSWLEKQGEQKPSTIDIDKMVDDYANNKERGNEEFGKPVPCMIRAYRQGLNDAIGKVVLKPAWSEEDEKMLVDAYVMIDWYEGNNWLTARHIKDWLKSLKERIGG